MAANASHGKHQGVMDKVFPSNKVKPTDESEAVLKSYNEKECQDSVNQFAIDVSIIGVKYIADSKSSFIRRLFWTCSVLAGVAFLFYHIHHRFAYFFSYPVAVNIDINHVDNLTFPAVTVCSLNPFKKSEMKNYNMTWLHHMFGNKNQRLAVYNQSLMITNWTDIYFCFGHKLVKGMLTPSHHVCI